MKLFMTRGVFYRDEDNKSDEGRTLAKHSVVEVPDEKPNTPPEKQPDLWKFAKGLLAQGRARIATKEDETFAKRQERIAALKAAIELEKRGEGEVDEEAKLEAELAALRGEKGEEKKKGKEK